MTFGAGLAGLVTFRAARVETDLATFFGVGLDGLFAALFAAFLAPFFADLLAVFRFAAFDAFFDAFFFAPFVTFALFFDAFDLAIGEPHRPSIRAPDAPPAAGDRACLDRLS
jgi:hypothetical protein